MTPASDNETIDVKYEANNRLVLSDKERGHILSVMFSVNRFHRYEYLEAQAEDE